MRGLLFGVAVVVAACAAGCEAECVGGHCRTVSAVSHAGPVFSRSVSRAVSRSWGTPILGRRLFVSQWAAPRVLVHSYASQGSAFGVVSYGSQGGTSVHGYRSQSGCGCGCPNCKCPPH